MTINVHETETNLVKLRDEMVEVGVWHLVSPTTGEMFKRYDFVDLLDTCLHRMRPWRVIHYRRDGERAARVQFHHGYCLLPRGHRGRHSTIVHYCDGCDRAFRGTPAYRDENVQFCFLCHHPSIRDNGRW